MITGKAITLRISSIIVSVSFALTCVATMGTPVLAAGKGPSSGAVVAPANTVAPAGTPVPIVPPVEEDRRIIAGNQVVSGGSFVLHSDETLRGDLTIFGGNAQLEEGSRVEGDVNIFGGSADISGTVTRNLTLIGGSARLRSSARIEGNESILGGSIQHDPGALVSGERTRFAGPSTDLFDRFWPFGRIFDLIGNVFATIAGIALATLFAIAVVALFPVNVTRIAETIRQQWAVSGGVGILSCVALPFVIAILAITICMIPAAILLVIAFVLAVLAGWSVVASILGERLMHILEQTNWTRIGQTALGAVVLALLGAIPFIGWLFSLAASALGLGALIMTRLGSQPYPQLPAQPPTPTAPPQLPTTTT